MSRSLFIGLIVCLCWTAACQPDPVSPGPAEPPATPVPAVPSEPRDEEVLATVPGEPSAPSLRRWEQQVDVRWEAPATDGGRPVTGYRVTCSPGDIQRDVAAPAHALRLQGMPAGTPLVCTVRARNAVGEGQASAASGPVVAVSPPSAPLEVKAEPGEREVRVSWTAPREEGGEPILGYVVESWPDGKVTRAVAGSRGVAVVELPSTQAYTFTVSALNDVGQGPRSFSTLAVRPRPAPAVFSRTSLSGGAEGCASLQYVLRQPDGLPADVKIEVDRRPGLFRPVTQAASTTHEGLLARDTSAPGTAHDFLWNRGADVPEAVTVRLRMSAQVAGAALATTTLTASLPAVGARCELAGDAGLVRSLDWTPHTVAAADIDRDGKRDLVVLPDDGGPLRILRGLGHGGFVPPSAGGYERGDVARPALAAVDLDGDGWVEMILSDRGGGVLVFNGRGKGLFNSGVNYSAGPASAVNFRQEQGLAVADFNGDGRPDVAVIAGDGSLYLLYNAGEGRLGSAVPARPAYHAPGTRLMVADINEDGRADLVAVNHLWGTYATLRSQGDGSFVQDVSFDSDVGGVVLGDFTGDGHVDLALAQDTDSGVRLWLRRGDGRGAFAGRVPVASLTGVPNAVKNQAPVTAADFDGDGRLDLAVALSETGQVAVRWGRGDGTFEPRGALLVAGTPVAVDVDSDGRMDLVTLESRAVSVRRGALHRSVPTPTPLTGLSEVGDLNADGWMDGVSAQAVHGDTRITVSLGGPGGFSPQPPVDLEGPVNRVLVDRIDADGTLDVLAINSGSEVTLLKGRGDGTLERAGNIFVDTDTPFIRVADVDADGAPDLLVSGHGADSEGFITMHAMLVRGRGDGTFLPPSTLLASHEMSEHNVPVEVGDVNGDGHLDVVVLMEEWNRGGQILLGQGDGTFQGGAAVQCGLYPLAALVLADLDRDQVLDLVCAPYDDSPGGRRFVFLKGSGQGTFARLGEVATGHCCLLPTVVDYDGDGHVDVLGHSVFLGGIPVFRGLGGGRFAPPELLEADMSTRSLSVLDADRDGLLDLLLSEIAAPNVLVRQE